VPAPFSTDGLRRDVRDAVVAVEQATSAEIVVAVRRASGDYRAADYLCGGATALAALLLLLFLPRAFALIAFPFDVTVAFAAGAWACSRSPALRRSLTPAARRRLNVHAAARAAFVDMGVGGLPGANGVLVYVSLLEREVEVVADTAVARASLGPGWPETQGRLGRAVREGDERAFVAALRALGPVLGAALPRQAHDLNELPDEVGQE
jgi:putative membrane protein